MKTRLKLLFSEIIALWMKQHIYPMAKKIEPKNSSALVCIKVIKVQLFHHSLQCKHKLLKATENQAHFIHYYLRRTTEFKLQAL